MPQGAQVLPYRRPDQDDEESLVLASIRGDVSAFARLYERYRGMLFGVCLRRTGSVTLAEDVVQDTFLRAFVNLSRFEYGKPIWPWLSRIAERRCIDLHRRTARVSIVDEVGEMEGGNVLGRREPSDTTLEAVMDAEDRREIERALAELPP